MKNLYLPVMAKVIRIEELSADIKLFRFRMIRGNFPKNCDRLTFTPGQFIMAGIWGYGEAPFAILSSSSEDRFMEILVTRVGTVTDALHKLRVGAELAIRGPYGNGFPISFFENKDIVMVSGGCGIPPIASLVDIEINPLNAVAAMCGPGPMMAALEQIIRPLGIADRRIYVSLERKMQCGIGKCQHCTKGDTYVCLDGPVYNFDEIDKTWD